MCAACVRKHEVGPGDKKRNVVSAMAGFPTRGDWHRSAAGHVNEACAFVCLEADIVFTRERQNLILRFHFALLRMCDACGHMFKFTCQQHVPFLLGHLRCWHGSTSASVDNPENGRTLVLLCSARAHTQTHTRHHTPLGFCPQMTQLHQKLPLEGKHAHTANLKRLITTQKWPT